MNPPDHLSPAARLDALESRFALRVSAALDERADEFDADIQERLRFAREQALSRARAVRGAAEVSGRPGGSAVLGGGWWFKLASTVPLAALVAGLLLISEWHTSEQVAAAAEIDAALLADELPLRAYNDPGFVEFLKRPQD
jgi:hypothetical protein